MFRDEILEKIFADNEMQRIPLGTQATAVSVIEKVLKEIKENDNNATISQLFTNE